MNYALISVPDPLYPEMVAILNSRMASKGYLQSASGKSPTPEATAPISDSLLKRIWDESGPTMQKTMKLLAAQPAQPVPAATISKALYGDPKGFKLPGLMGAFGRRSKNRYGHLKPFVGKWNGAAKQWEYTMPADVAKRIAAF